MAMPSSGQLNFAQIQNEFGGGGEIAMTEYYGRDVGIPGSGQISLGHFYGRMNHTPGSQIFYGTATFWTPQYYNLFVSSIGAGAGGSAGTYTYYVNSGDHSTEKIGSGTPGQGAALTYWAGPAQVHGGGGGANAVEGGAAGGNWANIAGWAGNGGNGGTGSRNNGTRGGHGGLAQSNYVREQTGGYPVPTGGYGCYVAGGGAGGVANNSYASGGQTSTSGSAGGQGRIEVSWS
jgi:hypothetical protein